MKSWIWLFGSDRSSGNANVCLSGTSLSKALHLISLAQIVKLKDSALSQISLSLLSAYRAEQMEPKSTSSFCNSIQCYCYFLSASQEKFKETTSIQPKAISFNFTIRKIFLHFLQQHTTGWQSQQPLHEMTHRTSNVSIHPEQTNTTQFRLLKCQALQCNEIRMTVLYFFFVKYILRGQGVILTGAGMFGTA